MAEKVLPVPEVHCGHCISSIEGAVGALPGVEAVSVHLGRKDVSVRYDEDSVSLDEIVRAIEEQGYDVGDGPGGMLQIGDRPSG